MSGMPGRLFPALGAVAALLAWPLAVLHQTGGLWLGAAWTPPDSMRSNDAFLRWFVPEGLGLSVIVAMTAVLMAPRIGCRLPVRGWLSASAWSLLAGAATAAAGLFGGALAGFALLGVFPLVGLPLLASGRVRAFCLSRTRDYVVWCVVAAAGGLAQEVTTPLDWPGAFARIDALGVGWEGPGVFFLASAHGVIAAAALGAVYGTHRAAKRTSVLAVPPGSLPDN